MAAGEVRGAPRLAPRVARRLEGVSESATLKLNATVQAMKARGEDVVNLTAGEPDFAVPGPAKDAVFEAVRADRSKYTPAAGVPELRELVAAKTNAQQPSVASRTPWVAGDVVITNGGKQALFNTLMALMDPGEEAMIPSPYWLSYPEMVKLAGGVPRFIETRFERGFKIQPSQLREAIGRGSRVLILNSPSNPTGATYSRDEYAALGKVILEAREMEARDGHGADLWVISDEIYDRIGFGPEPFCSFLEACPELRDCTVTVNGMSKSAAMTGWRVGWSVAPKALTQAMITLQGQCTSGVNALAQWASVAALKIPESEFSSQVEQYRKRRDLALENLKKAVKLKITAPTGAFYVFVGVGEYLQAGEDSIAFAQRVLEEAKVAVVPGTPFGSRDFVRLSFATDEVSLQRGCERFVKYLERA